MLWSKRTRIGWTCHTDGGSVRGQIKTAGRKFEDLLNLLAAHLELINNLRDV